METVINKQEIGVRALFKHKSYILMLTADMISRFGDSVDSIAYGWMVYMLTGSKLLLGTLFAVNALPSIVFSFFSGVIVDRLPKKKIIVCGDFGRGIIVSLTALLFMTGQLRPWHLFVFTFMNSTLEAFVNPSRFSMIPHIIPEPLFLPANSFSSSVKSFAELIGLAAAGTIIAVFGITGAIFIDGVTFFASSMLIAFIGANQKDINKMNDFKRSYVLDLKEGIKFVMVERLVLFSILLSAFANFCLAPFNVLQTVYVKDVLKSGPEGLSIIGVGFMIGMIISGLIMSQFGSRFKKCYLISIGGLLFGLFYALLGIPTLLSSIISPVIFAAIACFGLGFMLPVMTAPLSTYILKNTPKDVLGRVSSLMSMMALSAVPIGAAIAGALSERISISTMFSITGIMMMIAYMLPLLNSSFRRA